MFDNNPFTKRSSSNFFGSNILSSAYHSVNHFITSPILASQLSNEIVNAFGRVLFFVKNLNNYFNKYKFIINNNSTTMLPFCFIHFEFRLITSLTFSRSYAFSFFFPGLFLHISFRLKVFPSFVLANLSPVCFKKFINRPLL